MSEAMTASIDLFASDASGQRRYAMSDVAPTTSIRDLIGALIPRMGLSWNDSEGRAMDYQAFAKRDGSLLRSEELVGRSLKDGDEISLLPDIQAG